MGEEKKYTQNKAVNKKVEKAKRKVTKTIHSYPPLPLTEKATTVRKVLSSEAFKGEELGFEKEKESKTKKEYRPVKKEKEKEKNSTVMRRKSY